MIKCKFGVTDETFCNHQRGSSRDKGLDSEGTALQDENMTPQSLAQRAFLKMVAPSHTTIRRSPCYIKYFMEGKKQRR